MEVEMGATLNRTHRKRAERSGEAGQEPRPHAPAQPPALRGGEREHPHPPRGVEAGTDGLREGPWQLARTSGPVNLIADLGQKGSKDTAPKIRN